MSYEGRPNPDFSWSNARKELFEDCKRAYYYQYYGSHNGWWDEVDDPSTWNIYNLKNTMPLKTAFAEGVQRAITVFLSKPGKIGSGKFKEIITNRMHEICVNAQMKKWEKEPKQNPMVLEKLNYDNGFKNEHVKVMVANIKEQFNTVTMNFLKSPTVRDILAGGAVVENFDNLNYSGSFLVKGKRDEVVVWGKPDTVLTAEGKHIAVIWKMGTTQRNVEAEKFHADVIAIYLTKQYGVKFSEVEVRIEDLQAGETRTYAIESKEQHAAVLKGIGASIGKMAKFIEGKDIKGNKALGIDSFPQKEDHRACRQCRYFLLCKAEAEQAKTAEAKAA